jgi:Uma2 family endonuclease
MQTQILTQLPVLENGDRLTRQEFEQRYAAMPNLKKAELIEGVVYLASPVRIVNHGRPHAYVMGWLTAYIAATPKIDIADNTTVRLDLDNEPQPDAILRLEPECGGSSRITEDGYVEGAPELVVDIAASSASYDLHVKLNMYRRNGVQEYMVWQVHDRKIDWFSLQSGKYLSLLPDDRGILRSQVFIGLGLDVKALLNGDIAKVFATLNEELSTTEHQAFVVQLQDF